MSILGLLLGLIIIGVVLYFVNTYVPMPPFFKGLINCIVIIFVCVWFAQALGIFPSNIFRLR